MCCPVVVVSFECGAQDEADCLVAAGDNLFNVVRNSGRYCGGRAVVCVWHCLAGAFKSVMISSGLTIPVKTGCDVADGDLSKVAEQNKRRLDCLVRQLES